MSKVMHYKWLELCVTIVHICFVIINNNNNNNNFFCANNLEVRAQWRDKTKGLSELVIVKQCVSRQWIDEEARRLRRIGSIKEIGF